MPNSNGGDAYYLELLNGMKLPEDGVCVPAKIELDVFLKGKPRRVFVWLVCRKTIFGLRQNLDLLPGVDYRVWRLHNGEMSLWDPEAERDEKIAKVRAQALAARKRQEALNRASNRKGEAPR